MQGSAPELAIRRRHCSQQDTQSKEALGTSCHLTPELVQTGVVQVLLGLDRTPEMLAYQISSQGESFTLTAHRAASQWQRIRVGKGKAMVGTSLVNLPCKDKKGSVKEMATRGSGPAPRGCSS